MASLDKHDVAAAIDEDAPGQPISVPDASDTGESGKLKMIVQLVKKCLGVKDIAAMRLSLPASLLEPIPNLEYWQYLDRPDLFAAINDSDDPFERMLAVLRFTFSKDLKFIRGKVCKPYNSVLGEHFRSHWDVIPVSYPSDPSEPPIHHLYVSPPGTEVATSSWFNTPATHSMPDVAHPSLSETASVKSGKSNKSAFSRFSFMSTAATAKTTPATSPEPVEGNIEAGLSSLSLANDRASGAADLLETDETAADKPRIRIAFLTEQVSHHPPISAFHASCPSRHLELAGVDQISAKVSGTTLRVMPGTFNKGIYVRITGEPGEGEIYHITHPVASVNGLLRGSFYVTVGETTIITCSGGKDGQKLRAIIEYKEESWLGRAQFLCEGIIHTYDPKETVHEEWTRIKHVPRERVLAVFDGSWRDRVRWKRVDAPDTEYATLLDLSTLHVIPKTVRPLEKQLPTESRKLWENVTTKLISKEYSEATKHKLVIEQKQRDEAAERKRKGINFVPRYFDPDLSSGLPELTEEGRKAIEEELKEPADHKLEDESGSTSTPSSSSTA
ncbi:Oxysterol-binding protein-like protein 1 [Trametes pubescens]|uniref:Oxysterol-binding protein-like protein 1 n=1 Tax=Trametes pubescens TaxID=154538 RepID=A0A1M2V7A0_TRAPU|nr:Oxysterol-binding protein-like protein 1 [Trametes pubescens]